ncbi:ATP-binding protein [Streptomyces sp. NPDC094049]|uniref:ATP-binding protein n=1 Tax=Streptomyces sp. NPDC094049 TaxID=3154987 RepID=UPI003320A939
MTSEHTGYGERAGRLVLGDRGAVAARCRDFCRAVLADWDWPGPARPGGPTREERALALEDVLLVVSEAVTNACLHAGGPTDLVVRPAPEGGVRIEVGDRSGRVPRTRPRDAPGRPGGNGLVVIDRLTRAWGAIPREGGKYVWMEIAAPGARGTPAPQAPRAGSSHSRPL